MAIQQRVYDIDDLWQLVCDADDDKHYELIEGEIIEMAPTGEEHGYLTIRLGRFLDPFVEQHNLGRVTADTGYYPTEDRTTLLSPDVAFRSLEHAAEPPSQKWVPVMPDLAVEIISPSNTMAQIRRKAAIYLNHGTRLVWIIIPKTKSVEVCRLDASGKIQSEVIGADGALSGEQVLPGFSLELSALFS